MKQAELRSQLEQHHPAAYGWALHCCGRNADEAEDVLQTAYLKILGGKARFNDNSSFRTWLFGVIRNTAAEQRRSWWRRLFRDHQWSADRQSSDSQIELADPGAVAFDTLQAARSRGADVVIIDTAGRLHTKLNLMEELKKIQRVLASQGAESQRVILALDATTGQNGLMQARSFVDAVDCDGVFLAKLDGTAKGGVIFSIVGELNLPVLYIGTGEQPDDIAQFHAEEFVDALLSSGDDED